MFGEGTKQKKKKTYVIFHEWVTIQTNLHLSFIFVFFPKKRLKTLYLLVSKMVHFFCVWGGESVERWKIPFFNPFLRKGQKVSIQYMKPLRSNNKYPAH